MTLSISVHRIDASGVKHDVDLLPRAEGGEPSLAGFERWRTQFWGSAWTRSLGCELLPQLADDDLWVEGPEELERLAREVALVLARIHEFADDPSAYIFRLENVALAIEQAKHVPDGHGAVWIS